MYVQEKPSKSIHVPHVIWSMTIQIAKIERLQKTEVHKTESGRHVQRFLDLRVIRQFCPR